jgi:hypothetical protein
MIIISLMSFVLRLLNKGYNFVAKARYLHLENKLLLCLLRQYFAFLYNNKFKLIIDICFHANFSTLFQLQHVRIPLLLIRPLGL